MTYFWKGVLAAACLSAAASLPVQAAEADAACGTDRQIDIAEMTWASAAALAHIHAKILDEGFGCNVEIVTGDTVPTSTSMLTRGSPAIAPELWTSAIQEQWEKGIAAGDVVSLGDAIDGGALEAWFIPSYMAEEHPELQTAQDVVDHPELFPDPEDPSKGRFYSCPPGWACELANVALFEAYDMEENGWRLFSPGSGGNLDASIARAFEREAPILFYYWGPTAILGKYDVKQLDMPPVDLEAYQCNTDPDCGPARKTSWPSSPVVVGAASWVTDEAPAVAEYFGNVAMSSDQISALLAWADENKADAEATAVNFLKTEEDVWTKWVTPEVADKIRASLS
jgi:glycine betaine/proline transport system substrate-binding protein